MPNPVKYHLGEFPPSSINWEKLIPYIGDANASLARFDGMLSAIQNANVLLSPLATQEAVLSSKIEGTQATMGEVLEYEAGSTKEKRPEKIADINEILNYRAAIQYAEITLDKLPISSRLLKNTHKILLRGVRGKNKAPGKFRNLANWIGKPGCTIEEAKFVPVDPLHLEECVSTWEKYIHSNQPDKLVQLAIIHAEFEALHPFLDGNGRLGRMLIPLYLFSINILSAPTFYMSEYLEEHCDEYYAKLLDVSASNNWTDWCAFFLNAIIIQAQSNIEKASNILNLYEHKKSVIADLTHSQYSINALDFIFCRPIFKASDFNNKSGIPDPTAKRIIRQLREAGTIKTLRESSGRRSAIYVFPELLNIAEGDDIF